MAFVSSTTSFVRSSVRRSPDLAAFILLQRGFGPHSDQERVLESDLHKFLRFHYEVVERLARRN